MTVTTDATGTATATFYAGSAAGTWNIQATAGAVTKTSAVVITSDPASIELTVGAGLTLDTIINGEVRELTANVKNSLNQGVSNAIPVTFTLSAGAPGTISPTIGYTITTPPSTLSLATTHFTADASMVGSAVITASTGTITSNTIMIMVTPASASGLAFVSATPDVIPINTGTSSVKFKVTSSLGAPLPYVGVNFSFEVQPTGATLTPASGVTDKNGEVATVLHAGSVAGPVRILAKIISPDLQTTSGNISIGGGVPSHKWLSLAASRFNVEGLACQNVTSTIDVRMADRFGNFNILKGTSVSFATDYGAIDTSNVTDDTGATTAVWRSQAPYPLSDGRVTILVQTTGEENFTDNDMDGVYTGADDFDTTNDDLPEPFINSNDNGPLPFGTRDAGELFFDWPSTGTGAVPGAVAGVYNSGNLQWDANIPIWEKINIWMTGEPDMGNSRVECCVPGSSPCVLTSGNFNLTSNSYTTCYVVAADQNNNALIGGTKIALTFAPSFSDITVTDWGSTTLPDGPVNGPARVGFRLSTGDVTAPVVGAALQAKISWPGQCGSGDWFLYYPGQISVSP